MGKRLTALTTEVELRKFHVIANDDYSYARISLEDDGCVYLWATNLDLHVAISADLFLAEWPKFVERIKQLQEEQGNVD